MINPSYLEQKGYPWCFTDLQILSQLEKVFGNWHSSWFESLHEACFDTILETAVANCRKMTDNPRSKVPNFEECVSATTRLLVRASITTDALVAHLQEKGSSDCQGIVLLLTAFGGASRAAPPRWTVDRALVAQVPTYRRAETRSGFDTAIGSSVSFSMKVGTCS
jgi:hypothetical protein